MRWTGHVACMGDFGNSYTAFDGSHPDVSRDYQNRAVSVKHNLIYSLITIRLAKCFEPTGSSSGLLYEPVNIRKLRTSLGSQQCLKSSNNVYKRSNNVYKR